MGSWFSEKRGSHFKMGKNIEKKKTEKKNETTNGFLIALPKIISIISSSLLKGHISKMHWISWMHWHYFSPDTKMLILKLSC